MRRAAAILAAATLVFAVAFLTTEETPTDSLDRTTWTLLAGEEPIPVLLRFAGGSNRSFSLTTDCTETEFGYDAEEYPHVITGVLERTEPNCLPANVLTIAGYWSAASTVSFEHDSDQLDVEFEFEFDADAELPTASLRFARVDP